MSVPVRVVMTCPGCTMPVEMRVAAWSVTRGEKEDEGPGIVLESAYWAPHNCESR